MAYPTTRDIWEEKAKKDNSIIRVENADAKTLCFVYTGNLDKPCLIGFSGRRGKPDFNYSYSDADSLYAKMHLFEKKNKEWLERKAQERKERADKNKKLSEGIDVGSIFVASWGYEQTNVNAYQVIEKTGGSVKIREIAYTSLKGSDCGMSDKVVPVMDSFIENAETMTKRIQGDHLKIDRSQTAYLWDGESSFYRSWYY